MAFIRNILRLIVPQSIKDRIANTGRIRIAEKIFIERRYLGEPFKIVIADSLSRGWYDKDWNFDNRQEFAFFSGLDLPEDGLVFDVGAHQGLVALLLKRLVVPEGHVVAVEMDPLNAQACAINFQENSEDGITLVEAAVTDKSTVVRRSGRSNASVSASTSLFDKLLLPKVKSTTLGELANRYGTPDVVYLDIEGAEGLALRGAGDLVGQVPTWFVELHGQELCARFGGSNSETGAIFLNAGYRLYLSRAQDRPFTLLGSAAEIPDDRCYLIAHCG